MDTKRDIHNEYMRERITCDKCNGSYTRVNKQKHLKSSTHKKNTNDPVEIKAYLEERRKYYEKKIQKLSDERDKQTNAIDDKISRINM